MLSQETIKTFQQAIKEEYGKNIDLIEAEKMLSDLVIYFDKLAEINYNNKNK